jgi:hypothetical protein
MRNEAKIKREGGPWGATKSTEPCHSSARSEISRRNPFISKGEKYSLGTNQLKHVYSMRSLSLSLSYGQQIPLCVMCGVCLVCV